MSNARDFRAKLREIARARARGEQPAASRPPADSVVGVEEVWPASREEGYWRCRPPWPEGYPAPPLPSPLTDNGLAFDIESLGRTPKPLFLVGLAYVSPEGISFEQYLASHPEEEPAVLRATAEALSRGEVLLSYNGRTFDLPLLRDRLRYWRLPFVEPSRHLDLLGLVRRHYRKKYKMPACGLAEAERYLLGVRRPTDVSSSQVPELYERYVKIGDARPLEPVLRHNLYDLASTALLYLKMREEIPEAVRASGEEEKAETGDLF